MAAHRNVFIKGMDCDLSPAFVSTDKAYLIQNGEIISDNYSNAGSVANMKGNALSFIVPDLSDDYDYTDPFNMGFPSIEDIKVIGNTNIRENIILFSTDETGIPVDSYGQIWMLKYNFNGQVEWVHDLIEIGNTIVVRKWTYSNDGSLFTNGTDELFGINDQVLINETYTDTTPNPDVLLTKGEIWKFVANGEWEKVVGINVDKNKIKISNSEMVYILEPVIGWWDITSEGFPIGISNGDRYMDTSTTNNNIYVYNNVGIPHWVAYTYPGNGLYTVYNNEDNIRYYAHSDGWSSVPYSSLTEEYVWIGLKSHIDFDAYISGWHLFYENTLMPGVHLKYFNIVDFSQKNRVKAIGNIEDEDVGKVYWVDGYNVLRHINLFDEDCYSIPVNQIDIVSNIEFSQVKSSVTTGGVYKAGALQYSYQLYKKNGPETSFSPPSDLLSISSGNYWNGNDSDFRGTQFQEPDLVENTSKAAKVIIEDIDENFEYIKICALFYDRINATPRIRLVYDGVIPPSRNIKFVDSGAENLRSYSLEEYNMIGGMYIKPNDIEAKDNRIIVANYKESTFDIDYDARAVPWAHEGATFAVNIYDDINGGFVTYSDPANLSNIVETSDFAYDYDTAHYKYNADQTTNDWGGTGINVSYDIKLYQIEIDSEKNFYGEGGANVHFANNTYLDLESSLDSTFLSGSTYTSYAGDIIKSQLAGYQRGEKYRFGVIFIDIKGRRSPVKWIADIKMPNAVDLNTSPTYSIGDTDMYDFAPFFTVISTGGSDDKRDWIATTYANIMYVQFTLNNIPDDVISYQIVRMSRTEDDSTIICSGYFLPTSEMFAKDTHDLVELMEIKYDGGPRYTITSARVYSDNITVHPVGSVINHTSLYNWNPDVAYSADNYLIPRMMHTLYDIGGHIEAFQDHDAFPNAFEVITPDIIYSRTPIPNGSQFKIYGGTNNWAFFNNDLDNQDPPEADRALNRDTFFKFYGLDYTSNVISVDIDFSIFPTSDWYETRNNGHYLPGNRYSAYCTRFNTETPNPDEYKNFNAKKGITLICYTEDDLPTKTLNPYGIGDVNHKYQYLYGYVYTARAGQYGGNTYNARLGNEYIECGHIYTKTNNVAKVFGGDTYITMFEYNRVFCDLELEYCERNDVGGLNNNHKSQKTTYTEVIICPIETRYCLDYRGDKTRTQESTESYSYLMQEQLGNWEPDNNSNAETLTIFAQETDLYIYNPVYSQHQNVRRHYSPFVFEIEEDNEVRYDARIAISEFKINNQLSDSWLKFLPNNYMDMQYNYGAISGLKELNDGIVVFQKKAVVFIPVNEQALLNTSVSESVISLGTGNLLGKPQFISTMNGTSHRDSIIKTNSGVYFYDEVNNEIYIINRPMTPLTSLKGINTYLKQNVNKSILEQTETINGQGVIGAYDQQTGRIFFSFGRTVGADTVIYNEKLSAFETIMNISPYLIIVDDGRVIMSGHWNGESPLVDVGKKFYLSGAGDYGKFFDIILPFYIEVTIAPEYPLMKVYDNFEFTFNCENDPTIFFNNYYIDAGYGLASGAFSSSNSKFRFLKWRANIPRIDGGRMLGNTINSRFIYNNNENVQVVLNDIITHYRVHGMPFN